MSDEFAGWLDEATPDETSIKICLNRKLYSKLIADAEEAITELKALEQARKDSTTLDDAVDRDRFTEVAQRVIDAEQAVRDAEDRTLVLRDIGWRPWKELVGEHPPTDEQKKANARAEVNDDTFYPAALAACCVSPTMTVEQAEQLRDVLPRNKWWAIANAVERVNVGGSEVPKFVSSIVAQLQHELSSTTADPEESPSPSSADESESQESPTG